MSLVAIVYLSFTALVLGGIGYLYTLSPWWELLLIPVAPVLLVGVYDLFQRKHTVLRNFPIIGHFRYLLEVIRPEMQQYFVESDTSGRPVPRVFRSLIYQRAKGELQTVPFGTQMDVYEPGYEWAKHSITPVTVKETACRVMIGGPQCKKPYLASVFNISAMSFGALSKNAVLALNKGAKLGGFYHNTGEGGLAPYHLENGGDVVYQIGTGYFGSRDKDGNFSSDMFKQKASQPSVKMIEVKLSQGAKPGKGGVLLGTKVTKEIAAIRGVEEGKDCYSPPYHKEFHTPIGLLEFIHKLRGLSDGKPVGFKLCVGYQHEFIAICKAMIKTGILPDFITVDGGEGGTGAAPLELTNSMGTPLDEGLCFVIDCLEGFNLRDKIKVISAGKTFTGFHILKKLAMGADVVNSARGMMMALGCIQALRCHSGHCPTGVATQNPHLVRGLVVEDKAVRVARFHRETVAALCELMSAMGKEKPADLNRYHICRRTGPNDVKTYEDIFPSVEPGCLLQKSSVPERYKRSWDLASSETFKAQKKSVVQSLKTKKPKALTA